MTVYESKTPRPQPFLAIVLATNRPKRVAEFLTNLQATLADPSVIEVLIRADENDHETINLLKSQLNNFGFRICLLVEPNVKKTYQLHKAYNKLIQAHASESVYFFCNLTDEIRFETKGWDEKIKSYIKFFDDDIFRLTFSRNKLRNYYHFTECLYFPDNYPIITKKWLSLCGGWGEFWGTDSWQQAITYYLGLCKPPSAPEGVFRSIPLYDIQVNGQENGIGLTGERLLYHQRVIEAALIILSSEQAKIVFARLAARLAVHISATRAGHETYLLKDDQTNGIMTAYSTDKSQSLGEINYRFFVKEFSSYELSMRQFYYSLKTNYIAFRSKTYDSLTKISNPGVNILCRNIILCEALAKKIIKRLFHILIQLRRTYIHIENFVQNIMWIFRKTDASKNKKELPIQYYTISRESHFILVQNEKIATMIDSIL